MPLTVFKQLPNRFSWLGLLAIVLAFLLAVPILVILGATFQGDLKTWRHLLDTVLSDYVINSLILMVGVGILVLITGVPTAWLTSMCRFPGRKILSWALLLPLAFPAYIIAYTYTGILDVPGPVQQMIRDVTGLKYGQYWFFEIRSIPGAIFMMAFVLYPYVYLLARASFLEQSSSTLEACRTLGLNQRQAFFSLALPLARPAIVAGCSLALMEVLADYGTVRYFGVSTFTTGIYRAFNGSADMPAAAQLSSCLMGFVIILIVSERFSRRYQRYHSQVEKHTRAKPIELTGGKAWLATALCVIPVLLGFFIPMLQLFYWAVFKAEVGKNFFTLAWNSFSLALLAALLAVAIAIVLAYARRLHRNRWVLGATSLASMGYALPGTIIAIGVLVPFAWLGRTFEISLTNSIFILLFAYSVRFVAVSLGAVQSGLNNIKPSIDGSARSLGLKPFQVLQKVHVPLLSTSAFTALLIVFVDVLKELPATWVLRSLNFETLAVKAFELASDERLIDAAPASLLIVVVGILPVILLSRSINNPAWRAS